MVGGQAGGVDSGVLAACGNLPGGVLGGPHEGLGAAHGFLDAADQVDVEGCGECGDGGLVVCCPAEQGDVGACAFEGAGGPVEFADLGVEVADGVADAGGGAGAGPDAFQGAQQGVLGFGEASP